MAELSFDQPGPYIEDFTGHRYTYATKKAYVDVIKSLRASVASPAAVQAFVRESEAGKFSGEEFKAAVDKAANTAENPSGLFLFVEFNHGQWCVSLAFASYFST
jgi:hypothetical protein